MAKSKPRSVFVCQKCGAQRSRWEGRCAECGAWNSLVEEIVARESPPNARGRGWSAAEAAGPKVVALDENLESEPTQRISTGFMELDRVLGGGLVRGSFNLLGGDPGIGKSTLLLQMAGGL